jgi:hypothetical protein
MEGAGLMWVEGYKVVGKYQILFKELRHEGMLGHEWRFQNKSISYIKTSKTKNKI